MYFPDNSLRTSTISQNPHQLMFGLGWFEVCEVLVEPFPQHPLKGLQKRHFLADFIVDPPNTHFGRHGLDMMILDICITNIPTELFQSVLPPQVG